MIIVWELCVNIEDRGIALQVFCGDTGFQGYIGMPAFFVVVFPTNIFRGYPPNVILVMPEKAIKLTFNDYFRKNFAVRNHGGNLSKITVIEGAISGGMAGTLQVIVTNPMV